MVELIDSLVLLQDKMFHLWFNTFFISAQEEPCFMNGSSGNNSGNIYPGCGNGSITVGLQRLHGGSMMGPHGMNQTHHSTQNPIATHIRPWGYQDHGPAPNVTPHCYPTQTSVTSTSFPGTPSPIPGTSSPSVQFPRHLQNVVFRTLTLHKSELDRANKDKQHKFFGEHFQLKLFFTTVDQKSGRDTCPVGVLNSMGLNQMVPPPVQNQMGQEEEDDSDNLSDTDTEDEWSDRTQILNVWPLASALSSQCPRGW